MTFTRDELLRFMRTQGLAVQSSVSAAGAPQAAVVGIAVSDQFEIIFDTLASARKVPNLRANPRIAFVIGGLTDGDRAVFLADHFGASRIVLAGFDFGDEVAHPIAPERQRKFIWGALLIASLDNQAVMFLDEYGASRDPALQGRGEFGEPPSPP